VAPRVVALGHPENRRNLHPIPKSRAIAPQGFSIILNKGLCQSMN